MMGNTNIENKLIEDGIDLLQYSRWMKNLNWPKLIIPRLQNLYIRTHITFEPLHQSIRGAYVRDLDLLLLNRVYFYVKLPEPDRLPAISLTLAHEGMHAVNYDKESTSDVSPLPMHDEIRATHVATHYFREISRVGVYNNTTGNTVKIRGSFEDYDDALKYLEKDQLLDFLLNSWPPYREEKYINKIWIYKTIKLWRGIGNRWPDTRRLYVIKLLQDFRDGLPESYSGRLIVMILESIDSKSEWDEMIGTITREFGSLRPLQICFDELCVDRAMASQVFRLKKRWKTPLTEVDAALLKHPPRI